MDRGGLLRWSRIGAQVVPARGRVPGWVPGQVPALAAVSVPDVGLVVAQTPGRSPPQTSGNFHLALSLGCQKANAWLPPVWVAMYGKPREGRRRSRSVKTSRGGPETNPRGSDNLLTEVCALTSWKYSLLASLRESREQQQGQTRVPLLKHQPSPALELSTDPVEMKRGLRGRGLGGLRTRGSCGCRIRIHRQSFHPSEDRHGPIRLAAIPQIVVGETA